MRAESSVSTNAPAAAAAQQELRLVAEQLWRVPVLAVRLLLRRGHVLLIVAAIAAIAHQALLEWATKVAAEHPLWSLVAIAVGVVVTVFSYALMFVVLRSHLPARSALAAGDAATHRLHVHDAGFVAAAFAVVLPFLVFYGAWGLFEDDMSALVRETVVGLGVANPLDVPRHRLVFAAGAAFLARTACGILLTRLRTPVFAFAAAAFEALWLVFAFALLRARWPGIRTWVEERQVVVGADRAVDSAGAWLLQVTGPLARLSDAVGHALQSLWTVLDPLKYGLVEPALWMTIAAIAAGCQLDRGDRSSPLRSTSLARAVRRQLHPAVRFSWRMIATEVAEKYAPLVNGARVVAAAGAIPFLCCAMWYGVASLAEGSLEQAARSLPLLGEPDPVSQLWLDSLADGIDVAFVVVHVAVLAAGLELLLQQLIVRTAGSVEPRRSSTVPA